MTRFISIVAMFALVAVAQAQDARPARNVLILPFVMQEGAAHQAWLGPALFDNLQKQATAAGHTLVKAPAEALNPDGSLRPVGDEAQARRLGEAARAEMVLFGTFGVTAEQFNINGLMLDVRSGQVVGEVRGGGLLRELLGVEAGLTEQMLAALEGRQPQGEPMAEQAPAVPYDNQVPYEEQPGIVDPYAPAYPETVVVEQPVLVYPESYGYWSVGFGYGYSSYGYCGRRYDDYYHHNHYGNVWDYRADRRDHFDDHRDVNNDRGLRFREGERSGSSSDRVYSDRGSDRSRSTTSSDRRVVTVNGAGRVSESGWRDDSSSGTVTTARSTGGATARSGDTSRFREGSVGTSARTTSRAEPSPSAAPTPTSGSRTVRSTERATPPTASRSAPSEARAPSRAAPPTTTRRESPAPSRSAPPAEARRESPAPSRSAPPADSARSSRSEDRGGSFRSGGSSGGSSRDSGGSSRSTGGSSRSSGGSSRSGR